MHTFTLLTAALLGTATALPSISRSYAVKEYHPVPHGWTAVSKPSRSHMINLEIGLKHQNQDKLTEHLIEISDPAHQRYGQHLSAAEVRELIAPAAETYDLVSTWLAEHGIFSARLNAAGDAFKVRLPVEEVESLLDTTYSTFRHVDGTEYVRAPEWSLPVHLHEHIDIVQPTTSFFRMKKAATNFAADETIVWNGGAKWWQGPAYNSVSTAKSSLIRRLSRDDMLTDVFRAIVTSAKCAT
jgi:tripeptidyl-peptidase I